MSWSSATLVKCPLGLFMRSFLRLKVGNLHLGFRGVELSGLTEMIICTSRLKRGESPPHTNIEPKDGKSIGKVPPTRE